MQIEKMAGRRPRKILMGLVVIALPMVSCAYLQSNEGTPEGTWSCITKWSHERNGVNVPRKHEQQVTCIDGVMSTAGVLSIGTAQWSEKKEGTCYASGEELYGTWTSVQTAPDNDAARQFEQERLEGQSLATVSMEIEQEYRVRVTSRTDTKLTAVNEEGRVISCTRL